MTEILISYRRPARVALLGLIRILLILSLATASLPAFSGKPWNGNPGGGNSGGGSNVPPVISGTPPTSATAGTSYMFQPDASDADGDRLRFSIANMPAWANFSGRTGQLSGTPGSADVGSYSNIVISVSDRTTSTSLAAFNIEVDAPAPPPNSAPVISGDGTAMVVEGSLYSFQPTATDTDGDPLSFSIANKPVWASFNSSTGGLSGTPGAGTAGTYSNIVIAVSDGTMSTSLPAFNIEVDAPAAQTTGSASSVTVFWDAPLVRVDGTALLPAEIAGYHIDYGDSVGNYTNTINLADGTATSVTLTDLPIGNYSLVITAYDVDGRESEYSNVSSFSLP